MKKVALLILNHNIGMEYDNYTYSIMEKNLSFFSYEIISLKNKKCTKVNLIDSLTKLKTKLKSNDQLIFYYSGHTCWSPWRKGFIKFFDFKAYHVLYGGKQNWVSNNYLMTFLEQIKCKKSLIFDTCCGPLIQLHNKKNTQIITISDKLGKSKPIIENSRCIPAIAFYISKMVSSEEKYNSFSDYIKDNTQKTYITFSGTEFIF